MADLFVWPSHGVDVETVVAVRETRPLDRVDVSGYAVEATDGKIGDVDDATYDVGQASLVVDTGFWIFGTKRLIPAGLITAIDADLRIVHLGVTKEDVRRAPDLEDERRTDASFHDEVGRHYAGLRGDPIGPVAGTGRDADELTGDTIAPVAGIGNGST